MSKRIVCDHCGKDWSDTAYVLTRWKVLKMNWNGSLKSYDLCEDCWRALGEFLNNCKSNDIQHKEDK